MADTNEVLNYADLVTQVQSLAEVAAAYTDGRAAIQAWQQEIVPMAEWLTTVAQPEPTNVLGVNLASGERAGVQTDIGIDYDVSYSNCAPDESCYTIDPLQAKFRRVATTLKDVGDVLTDAARDFEKIRSINAALRHDNYQMRKDIAELICENRVLLAHTGKLDDRIAELQKKNEELRLELSSIYRDEERAA